MTIVAIHQPNYLPWLGYFAKMASADVFVLLDDVQYSKGSFTNRVQIARAGAPAWLTLPVQHRLGASIRETVIARADWAKAHCDTLKQAYRKAACFRTVWPFVESMLAAAEGALADVNTGLIRSIADHLGITARIEMSSSHGLDTDLAADERLSMIVHRIAPGATYLSGSGGAKYQSETTFAAHGLTLTYSGFTPTPYDRGGEPFLPGLSILDALFHLGWEGTAALLPMRR